MIYFVILGATSALLALLGTAFILGRRYASRVEADPDTLSPVCRQHFELFRGGELNPLLVDAAKMRIEKLLDQGRESAVEAGLRAGEQYVVQVRALAEVGTEAAARILEGQLQRRISDDHLEQSWYQIDIVTGLRQLNREESLPKLLRCADFAAETPLGPVFAAETMSFLGFVGYLREPNSPLGKSALRLLHRVLEGFRTCLPPQAVVETRLGEMLEAVWDARTKPVQPLVVRVLAETRRYVKRVPAGRKLLAEEPAERETFDWQAGRLEGLEPELSDYLADAVPELLARLTTAEGPNLRDLLMALADLKVDAAEPLLPMLSRPDFAYREAAIDLLAHSRDPRVGPWLRSFVRKQIAMTERTKRRRIAPLRAKIPGSVPYVAVLSALKHHPSAETEAFLVLAAQDREPKFRAVAFASLGWWEPVRFAEMIACLKVGRLDENEDANRAAVGALARLGEREALQGIRQAMFRDDPQQVHDAIHMIGSEGLALLWPDLDQLLDSDNPELAYHAAESVVALSERMN